MLPVKHTWIVTADAGRARFYRSGDSLSHLVAARLDLVSDAAHQPASDAANGTPLESRHDSRKPKEHQFAHQLARALDEACADASFAHLVLVAPARLAGELRRQVSDQVRARLSAELHKDLVHLSAAELWPHVATPVRNIAVGLPS